MVISAMNSMAQPQRQDELQSQTRGSWPETSTAKHSKAKIGSIVIAVNLHGRIDHVNQ